MDPTPTLTTAVPVGATAYLLTVAPDGRPHATPTTAVVRDPATVAVSPPGRRTRANLEAGSAATVLWSPADGADHTLIVDGVAEVHDDVVVVRPSRAVLHRASPEGATDAAPAPGDACAADCLEIPLA